VPDPIFADPRLAAIYDDVDADRSDLDAYVAMVEELAARRVLDVGCGTGTLAVMLAARGCEVVAVDPAEASLQVARRKPGADRVRWVRGDASALPPLAVDLTVMTGNVAQVFTDDSDWSAALRGIHGALRREGVLVFESRDPDRQAWRDWSCLQTLRRVEIAGLGSVECWVDVLEIQAELVSFRWTYVLPDDTVLTSDSTLRFRSRAELTDSLRREGFATHGVRDAPARPGEELVFIARRVD
jgi:SAM-dependent methyltransferase